MDRRKIAYIGDEEDMLSPWRRVLDSTRGKAKAAKRSYNKRVRRQARKDIQDWIGVNDGDQ